MDQQPVISSQQAMGMNTSLLFFDMLALPFFGWLTLHIAKETLMLTALLAAILFSVPFFMMLDGASAAMTASIRVGLVIIGVCFSAPYHA